MHSPRRRLAAQQPRRLPMASLSLRNERRALCRRRGSASFARQSQRPRADHDRARSRDFAGVSRLSAWPGFLARHDRRFDWSARPLYRVRQFRFPRPRPDILALGVQHDFLHGRRQHPEVWLRPLSRALAQSPAAHEVAHPRCRAVAVRHADRASAIAFWWIYDPQFSIISWSLIKLGLINHYIDFLGRRGTRAGR